MKREVKVINFLDQVITGFYIKDAGNYMKVTGLFVGQPGNVSLNVETYSLEGKVINQITGLPLNIESLIIPEKDLPWKNK